MKRRPRRGVYKAIRILGTAVFFLLLIGSLGWVYRSSFLTGTLKVEIARQGSIEHLQTVAAVFANEETLVKAPIAGTPKFLFNEGERVRKGDSIAVIESEGATLGQEVSTGSKEVQAPGGGLVFSAIDGLETYLTPENLLAMDVGKVLEQSVALSESTPTEGAEQSAQVTENTDASQAALSAQTSQGMSPEKTTERVASGRVIGKVVNNLRPTVAVVKVDTQGFEVGKSVKLIINDQTYNAKILRILENPQGLVVQFNQYINGTSLQRLQDITLVTKPAVSGVLIPKSSLWIKGEEQGVYVVKGGAIQYRKVKILDKNDQVICVENLPHGIPVITNPRSGLDGLIINVKNMPQS